MEFHRQLSDYWRFSRRYAQFERLFDLSHKILHKKQELSASSLKKIARLNRKRECIQREIGELNLNSLLTCADCKGKCCQDNTEDYFTAIDFLMKKSISGKVIGYSGDPEKNLYYYLRIRLKQLFGVTSHSSTSLGKSGCSYLSKTGCTLDNHERPIKCIVATCKELRIALHRHPRMRERYIHLIEQLFFTSLMVLEIQKRESGLPKRYGRLSLAFTPVWMFFVYFAPSQGQTMLSILDSLPY